MELVAKADFKEDDAVEWIKKISMSFYGEIFVNICKNDKEIEMYKSYKN